MSDRPVKLAIAVEAEVKALLPVCQVERRYLPRLDREELEDAVITALYIDTALSKAIVRGLAKSETVVLGLAVQRATSPGSNDLTIGDEVVNIASQLRALWMPKGDDPAPAGALFRKEIEGFTCGEEVQFDLPDPFIIAQKGVYTALVGVTYIFNGE